MEIGLVVSSSFLGTNILALIMIIAIRISYGKIQEQGIDLSEYFFNVPRQPEKPDKSVTIEKRIICIIEVAFLVFVGLLLLWYKLMSDSNLLGQMKQFSNAWQVGINVLMTMAVTAVVIFATLKKPYYILFNTQDVIKKYRIREYMLFAIVAWALLAIMGTTNDASFTNLEEDISSILLTLHLFFQFLTFASSLWVLLQSCRIFLSDKKIELRALDVLHLQIHYQEIYLQHIEPTVNKQGLDMNNEYVVEQFKTHTEKFVKQLKKFLTFPTVNFWESTREKPFPEKKKTAFRLRHIAFGPPLLLFVIFLFLSAFGASGIIFALGEFVGGCKILISIFVTILTLIIVFFIAFIITEKKQIFYQLLQANAYGRWGYCFLNSDKQPEKYFLCYRDVSMWPNQETKWYRTLLNLLVLFRIELASNLQEKLRKRLHNELFEIAKSPERKFALALAYDLCLRLEQEKLSSSEMKKERKSIFEVVENKKLLASWSDAIWIDIKRDMEKYKKHE